MRRQSYPGEIRSEERCLSITGTSDLRPTCHAANNSGQQVDLLDVHVEQSYYGPWRTTRHVEIRLFLRSVPKGKGRRGPNDTLPGISEVEDKEEIANDEEDNIASSLRGR